MASRVCGIPGTRLGAPLDLFTGGRSERNVRMYMAAGYELSEPPGERLGQHISGAVFLTKKRRTDPSLT